MRLDTSWIDNTLQACVFFTRLSDIKQVATPNLLFMIDEDVSTEPDDVGEGDIGVTWVTLVFRPPDI